MRTAKLKICGLTSKEQALAIAALGVDALGFVLYPASPRFIPPHLIKKIIKDLPPFIKTVGVFVNEPIEKITDIFRKTGLDLVQLSGDESPEYCRQLSNNAIPWLKAFRIKDNWDSELMKSFQTNYILVDAWSSEEFGGTGKTFDWLLVENRVNCPNIILAGGINPQNIKMAIDRTNPYAIDVSSGVEISPGVKDLEKVKLLIAAIEN